MNQKRILFVEQNLRNEKLGIMYLSASLRSHGHETRLVQSDKDDLAAFVKDFRPDFAAFSICTGEHERALKTARSLKKEFGLPSIFGGPHCTFFPEFGFEPGVDFMVSGPGEQAIVDIIEGRERAGFVRGITPKKLDALEQPDRELFYRIPDFAHNPMKNILTARSCPNRCSYCFNHSYLALSKIDGETECWFDRRSPQSVIAEIEQVQKRWPLERVLFIDDNFVLPPRWVEEFCALYKEKIGLPWMCSMRMEKLTDALAETCVKSGLCMVNYALESADPEVQQKILNRGKIKNSDIIRGISFFNRFGVRARMQNMIGLPLQNPLEDALNTLQFNLHHRITDAWCSILQPYPRTALGQYCVEHGFITSDQIASCSESFFDESRLSIPDRSELANLQKLWYFIVDAGLDLDLVQILIRGVMDTATAHEMQNLRYSQSREKLYGIQATSANSPMRYNSREPAPQTPTHKEPPPASSASLILQALTPFALPAGFAALCSRIILPDVQVHNLKKHLGGAAVFAPPLYTVNDETGELADPAVSIFARGASTKPGADIREMTDRSFVKDIVDVRRQLSARDTQGGA